jgi:hypothetical protein
MAIILKANTVNLFVSSVLFIFWHNSPNVLDTPRIKPINSDFCCNPAKSQSREPELHPGNRKRYVSTDWKKMEDNRKCSLQANSNAYFNFFPIYILTIKVIVPTTVRNLGYAAGGAVC